MSMYGFLEYTAGQYMTREVVGVARETTLGELGERFAMHDFNAFPVLTAGNVVGLVTKFDFLKAFALTTRHIVPHYADLMGMTVGDVMTEAVVDVQPNAPLTRVLQLMVNLKARSFPVRERDGTLVGMISREDIMRALKQSVQQAG